MRIELAAGRRGIHERPADIRVIVVVSAAPSAPGFTLDLARKSDCRVPIDSLSRYRTPPERYSDIVIVRVFRKTCASLNHPLLTDIIIFPCWACIKLELL